MSLNSEEPSDNTPAALGISSPGVALFFASFISLFLELLLIRWVPSIVRVVAYYGNLMLLSSFLGLGSGLLVSHRRLALRRWFPAALIFFGTFLVGIREIPFHQGPDELRFLFKTGVGTTTLPIAFIFIFNALVFVPLGDLIGSYFLKLEPLKAYSWDLGGAIAGTTVFGVFSYFWFSPAVGLVIVMATFLIVHCRSTREIITAALFFAVGLGSVIVWADRAAIWSPYSHITVKGEFADSAKVSTPPENLATMRDPPFYTVQVNQDFYMWNGSIDLTRYSNPRELVRNHAEQYRLPHLVRPDAKDVLVVGSGGGVDVEAALLSGASRIDAVEIDPVIIQLGRRYNASKSYDNPRVFVHNTDARGYFKQTQQRYDMVVFGFLDSQSLFSQMSNIRLDGYVYTRESFREAFSLLRAGGLLSVSFFSSGKMWLVDRLVSMVGSASGVRPIIYLHPSGQVIVLAGKGFAFEPPLQFGNFQHVELRSAGTPEALDDWPYLYLRQRVIPLDYLTTIAVLLLASLLCIWLFGEKHKKGVDLHFFFLGAGFLLLETKSITTISLYFGATWLVSMIVILGVLVMVFLANIVASRMKRFTLLLYAPLAVSILFLYVFPTQAVLSWSFALRLLFSLIVIPLPIFFAGLIFSSTFRDSTDTGYAFGSNLLGAMMGGFAEYVGMITGTQALLLIVLVFYLASFWVRWRTFNVAAVS
jgi:spermine/spermidine synthase